MKKQRKQRSYPNHTIIAAVVRDPVAEEMQAVIERRRQNGEEATLSSLIREAIVRLLADERGETAGVS